MKKLNLIILVILLLLSVFTVSVYAEKNEAPQLLLRLGAIDEASLEILNTDDEITRAEFAKLLSSVARLGFEGEISFSDVSEDNPYIDAIKKISGSGFMKGDGKGLFNPDAGIKEIDALVTLLRVLGYDEYAGYLGGYPTGYISAAKTTGITSGVSAISLSENIKPKKLTILLMNMLNERMYEISSVGTGGYSLELSDKTFLSAYYGIKKVEGIMTAGTNSTLERIVEAGGVVIGDRFILTDSEEYDIFLGYHVEAYYNDETGKMIYLSLTDKNKTFTVSSGDYVRISGTEIYYEKGYNISSVSYSKDAHILYNNRAVPAADFSLKLFDIKNGDITLIDNNRDGKYEVVSINEFKTLIVDNVDSVNMRIDFKYGDKSIGREELEKKVIFEKDGLTDLTWLHEWDALDVKYDASGSVVSIYRAGKLETVVAESISLDGKESEITLNDGRVIRIAPQAISRFGNGNFKLGEAYLLSTNKDGFAVAWTTTNDRQIAAIMDIKEVGSFEKDVYLKYYTSGGELKTVMLGKYFTVNDERKNLTNPADREYVLSELKKAVNNLVEMKFDKAGMPVAVDIMEVWFDKSIDGVSGGRTYSNNAVIANKSGTKGTVYYFKKGAPRLVIPVGIDTDDIRNYSARTASSYPNAESIQVTKMYRKRGSTSPEADATVDYRTSASSSSAAFSNYYEQPALISSVSKVYDADEGAVYTKVTYFHSGAERVGYADDEAVISQLHPGDLINLEVNDRSQIEAVKVYFDGHGDEKKILAGGNGNTGASIYGYYRSVYGIAYDVDSAYYTILPKAADGEEVEIEPHRFADNIYVFEKSKGKARLGSVDDIIGYNRDPENASHIYAYSSLFYDYVVVIYK